MRTSIKMLEILGYKFDVTESHCKVTFGKKLIYGAGDFDGIGGKLNNSVADNLALAQEKASDHYNAASLEQP